MKGKASSSAKVLITFGKRDHTTTPRHIPPTDRQTGTFSSSKHRPCASGVFCCLLVLFLLQPPSSGHIVIPSPHPFY